MNKNKLKLSVAAAAGLSFVAMIAVSRDAVRPVSAIAADDTPETTYKAKCAMCHSPKAEKAYDPNMPIEQQVEAILKGKKAEKPPNMPGYETRGINAEQAKALAEYMKALRTPPATE